MTATGFSCADCGHELQDDTKNMEASASRDKLSRLMHQIERIINMLKEIDSAFVPEYVTTDNELSNMCLGPRQRSSSTKWCLCMSILRRHPKRPRLHRSLNRSFHCLMDRLLKSALMTTRRRSKSPKKRRGMRSIFQMNCLSGIL